MPIHLQREIERLKKDLLSNCAIVEDQLRRAVRALLDRDPQMAREVERRDAEVDRREIEVEEDCLKTLALHQPVASDLRLMVSALKINSDLERIGDLAVNIARKAAALAEEPPVDVDVDLGGMWEKVQAMLRDSLDSLVNMDAALAESVCARDDEVDRRKHEIRLTLEEAIRREPVHVRSWLKLLAVSRNLERVADSAVSIAQDVTYLVTGKIVRHHLQ